MVARHGLDGRSSYGMSAIALQRLRRRFRRRGSDEASGKYPGHVLHASPSPRPSHRGRGPSCDHGQNAGSIQIPNILRLRSRARTARPPPRLPRRDLKPAWPTRRARSGISTAGPRGGDNAAYVNNLTLASAIPTRNRPSISGSRDAAGRRHAHGPLLMRRRPRRQGKGAPSPGG